jgi:hypothetical protein
MIVEYVLFKYPPGWTREQILQDARPTAVKWRANKELIRKHYIADENGQGGAFYIWPSKESAQRGHDETWRANIEQRTGSTPVIRYFDLMMIVDNEAGSVTEFPPNILAQAAE